MCTPLGGPARCGIESGWAAKPEERNQKVERKEASGELQPPLTHTASIMSQGGGASAPMAAAEEEPADAAAAAAAVADEAMPAAAAAAAAADAVEALADAAPADAAPAPPQVEEEEPPLPLLALPDGVLAAILRRLEPGGASAARAACRRLRELSNAGVARVTVDPTQLPALCPTPAQLGAGAPPIAARFGALEELTLERLCVHEAAQRRRERAGDAPVGPADAAAAAAAPPPPGGDVGLLRLLGAGLAAAPLRHLRSLSILLADSDLPDAPSSGEAAAALGAIVAAAGTALRSLVVEVHRPGPAHTAWPPEDVTPHVAALLPWLADDAAGGGGGGGAEPPPEAWAERLGGLEAFKLVGWRFSERALSRLTLCLPRLVSLVAELHGPLGPAGIAALAALPALADVRLIGLTGVPDGGGGAAFAAGRLASLTTLSIMNSAVNDEDLAALVRLAPGLEELELLHCMSVMGHGARCRGGGGGWGVGARVWGRGGALPPSPRHRRRRRLTPPLRPPP